MLLSATRVSEILKGKRLITVDTALRLSKYFWNSVEFWVGIQADYENWYFLLFIDINIMLNNLLMSHSFVKPIFFVLGGLSIRLFSAIIICSIVLLCFESL